LNIKLIPIQAPPAPKCFEARDIWVEYLISTQKALAGKKATERADSRTSAQPFVNDRYNPHFAFCRDCPAKHAHAMSVEGRCDFKGYVASLTAGEKEQAHAA
jgi:hypothetical protein